MVIRTKPYSIATTGIFYVSWLDEILRPLVTQSFYLPICKQLSVCRKVRQRSSPTRIWLKSNFEYTLCSGNNSVLHPSMDHVVSVWSPSIDLKILTVGIYVGSRFFIQTEEIWSRFKLSSIVKPGSRFENVTRYLLHQTSEFNKSDFAFLFVYYKWG